MSEGSAKPEFHRMMHFFSLEYVDDIQMTGTTQSMPKMEARLRKTVGLDDPVSFIYQVYIGCT